MWELISYNWGNTIGVIVISIIIAIVIFFVVRKDEDTKAAICLSVMALVFSLFMGYGVLGSIYTRENMTPEQIQAERKRSTGTNKNRENNKPCTIRKKLLTLTPEYVFEGNCDKEIIIKEKNNE